MKALLAALVVGVLAGAATADVTYTWQSRQIRASLLAGESRGETQTFTAPDFGELERTAMVKDFFYSASGTASQHSLLLPAEVVVSSDVMAQDGLSGLGGEGESLFDVLFEVSEETPFSLIGNWALQLIPGGYPQGVARITFSDFSASQTIFESKYDPATTTYAAAFDASGVLPAGVYRLYARVQMHYSSTHTGGGDIKRGSLAATLSLGEPCAVDLNQDGIVDFSDYLEFLTLFDAGDPRADFTGDGIVDFGDYLEFLNLFEQGC